ncbi:MAG: hypothetical protein KZQ93_19865 [Candidatus Thiodiazotropha sp. (ex Monitilora ramsayi)]|nr:hypothetical protein [Candidatus Thiodiazotropha sp. (ex Monitilora ramsayi)]
MSKKPNIGLGGIYLVSIILLSFNSANTFVGGVLGGFGAAVLFSVYLLLHFPKFIHLAKDSVTFEYYFKKPQVIYFNNIRSIRKDGFFVFRGRILFKNGTWSDVLNYSLLTALDKKIIIDAFLKYLEINPNQEVELDAQNSSCLSP